MNTPEPQYEDFELKISGHLNECKIEVTSPAGTAHGVIDLPFSEQQIKELLQKLEDHEWGANRAPKEIIDQASFIQEFGKKLFDSVFSENIALLYRMSQNIAAEQQRGLRLKFRFQSPALAVLPWEFLYDQQTKQYLARSTKSPIVRYLGLPRRPNPFPINFPIQILGMIANPQSLPGLDMEREKVQIEDSIKELCQQGLVEITWIAQPTRQALHDAMRKKKWHIFHFVGHGYFHNEDNKGIYVIDEKNEPKELNANELGDFLGDCTTLRLVLLNTCRSGQGNKLDLFSSTAALLVQRSIPAVLAMQYTITDSAAIQFATSFYKSLADGFPVDACVAEGRKAINNESFDWGSPVLYTYAPDGQIFNIIPTQTASNGKPNQSLKLQCLNIADKIKLEIQPDSPVEEEERHEIEALHQPSRREEAFGAKQAKKSDLSQETDHSSNVGAISLLVIGVLIAFWFISGTVEYWQDSHFKSYKDALWWACLVIIDPGNLADCQGVIPCGVGGFLAFIGIIMYGGIIGSIATAVLNKYFEDVTNKLQSKIYSAFKVYINILALLWTNRRQYLTDFLKTVRSTHIIIGILLVAFLGVILYFKFVSSPAPQSTIPPLTSSLGLTPPPGCNAQRACIRILIAPLNATSLNASKVKKEIEHIREGLNYQDKVLPQDINVELIEENVITDEATFVQQKKAALLLWSNNLEKGPANITLNDGLETGASTEVHPFRLRPVNFATFAFPIEQSNTITNTIDILALTAIGLANYAQGREEKVIKDLGTVLYCLGEKTAPELQDSIVHSACYSPGKVNLPIQTISSLRPQIHYYIGKALVLQGNYQLGIDYLKLAQQALPSEPAIWASLGDAHLHWTGGVLTQPAYDAFRQAITATISIRNQAVRAVKTTQELKAEIDLGMIWRSLGDYAKAEQHFEQAKVLIGDAQNQMTEEILFLLADTQQKNEEKEAARSTLNLVPSSMVQSPWFLLAQAQLAEEDNDETQKLLEKASLLSPYVADIDINIAELYSHWKETDKQLEAYKRALGKRPNSGWLEVQVGNFYRSAFLRVQEKQSRFGWLSFLFSPFYTSDIQQHLVNAETRYVKAQKLRSSDPWAYEKLAFIQLQLGKFQDANKNYKLAIDYAAPEYISATFYCNQRSDEGGENKSIESQKLCKNLQAENAQAQEKAKILLRQLQELDN